MTDAAQALMNLIEGVRGDMLAIELALFADAVDVSNPRPVEALLAEIARLREATEIHEL